MGPPACSSSDPARVMTCIRETGPCGPVFQAVLEFQSNTLQASLLPRYQKLWLWFVLQQESYFGKGREEYIKRDPERLVVRTTSGKISSKQVGEELSKQKGIMSYTIIEFSGAIMLLLL